jgi:hypothetical protein
MKKLLLTAVFALLLCSTAFAGAWGAGSFENDSALDWLTQCERKGSLRFIEATIEVANKQSYIEVDEGSALVAAAEVVAAVAGRPNSKPAKNLANCTAKITLEEANKLAAKARTALERVMDTKKSELAQLWKEQNAQSWLAAISDLKNRLPQ